MDQTVFNLKPLIKTAEMRVGFSSHESGSSRVNYQFIGNDCCLLVQGFAPQADVGAREASKIGPLAYRVMSKLPFYQTARGRMIDRIFSSSARKMFRLQGRHEGLKVAMSLVFCTSKMWWAAMIGDMSIYLLKDKGLEKLLSFENIDGQAEFFGQTKQVKPEVVSGDLHRNDRFILTSRSFTQSMDEKTMSQLLNKLVSQNTSCEEIAQALVKKACEKRKQETYGVLLAANL